MTPSKQTPLKAPMLHFVMQPFHWLRSQASRPLQTKVLPKQIPKMTGPGLKNLIYVTYGDILLLLPIPLLIFAGYYFTFSAPDVSNSGIVASIAMALVFFAANKFNSIVSFLFGISFERLIIYHEFAAFLTGVLTAFHAYAAWNDDASSKPTTPDKSGSFRSGFFITIALGLLVATSAFPIFRRRFFDIWLATHFVLIVWVAASCIAHSVFIVIIAGVWWLIDCISRYIVMTRCLYPATATLRTLRPDVVEIRFTKPKRFHYRPGQFLRLAIPKISAFQFHPFSLSSAPHEEEVTLHIRALGDWTQRLLQIAEQEKGNEIKIWIEGPFGILSVDLDSERYRTVLCVSGGIGVTHCRSVARSLLHDHHCNARKLDRLRFVWAVRDYNLVNDLQLFEDTADPQEKSVTESPDTSMLQAEVYLSKQKSGGDIENLGIKEDGQNFVVRNGRPDLDKIFNELREEAIASELTHIAVFGCGPQSQIDALKEACRNYSKRLMESKGVYFDLHSEVFEF